MMELTNVLSRATLLLSLFTVLASAEILSQPFSNPFETTNVKYTIEDSHVRSSIPYKEAKGSDRELVEQILLYTLTLRDIDQERANLESS